ncbi:hypothetical protein BDV97DRAFT_186947 [Delphinella strobiligena]|nr:hypothetical protein BDV97DRAFT_186947 [Delphinella strobiligena]
MHNRGTSSCNPAGSATCQRAPTCRRHTTHNQAAGTPFHRHCMPCQLACIPGIATNCGGRRYLFFWPSVVNDASPGTVTVRVKVVPLSREMRSNLFRYIVNLIKPDMCSCVSTKGPCMPRVCQIRQCVKRSRVHTADIHSRSRSPASHRSTS